MFDFLLCVNYLGYKLHVWGMELWKMEGPPTEFKTLYEFFGANSDATGIDRTLPLISA